MNSSKQKLIIQNLLSSPDVFSRCNNIIKSIYFDPEYRSTISFIKDYYQKYHALPTLDIIKSEFDLDFNYTSITQDQYAYTCDEIEKFCKNSGIIQAIQSSLADIEKNKFDVVTKNIMEAVSISLEQDLGYDLYENTEENLYKFIDDLHYYPTGIKSLDEKLGGGLARKQFTLFSANSGGGKSVVLSNIGNNYADQGMHVLYISLELAESMVYVRNASISSGVSIKNWKENITEISHKIKENKNNGAGSYIMKRLKNGSNSNDIRSYLKQYELKYKRKPDVIIIDYLDLMDPIGGKRSLSISEQDKAKSEELYEIGVDYDAIMVSASQQNREAIKMATPDQSVIAGGLTKINVVDNYISIFMNLQMRIDGMMILYFLKTRSSDSVGTNIPLKFNPKNLQINDGNFDENHNNVIKQLANKKKEQIDKIPTANISNTLQIRELPGIINEEMNEINSLPDVSYKEEDVTKDEEADLASFMSFLNR